LKETIRNLNNKFLKITCVKRIVGGVSVVHTSRRIAKDIILAVDRELKEKIKILIDN